MLTEQLHTLSVLSIVDYVIVTRVFSGDTIENSGYMEQICPEYLVLELSDGSMTVIDRFLSLRLCSPTERVDCVDSSEWSDVDSESP